MSTAYTLLTVVQAVDLEAAREIEQGFRDVVGFLHEEPGYERAALLTEENDCLVMLLTIWTNPAQAELFRCSSLYQLILSGFGPRIVGAPVVRIFKQHADGAE
jgi:heme-degrading monooxygenase HmoA